jgi:hypothetical protein
MIQADVAVAATYYFNPLWGVLSFIPVVFVETLILKWLRWDSWGGSFAAALLMNTFSTFAGVVLIYTMSQSNDNVSCAATCVWRLTPGAILFVMGALSILLEFVVLTMFWRRAVIIGWKAAFLTNIASYLVLSPLFLYVLSASIVSVNPMLLF